MKRVIAPTHVEVGMVDDLLSKDVPTYRQAYSDRTSWLMACFSELAYIRFNPFSINNQQKALAINYLDDVIGNNKSSALMKLLDTVAYDYEAETEKLKQELLSLKASLVKTFDTDGTQAILIDTKKFIVLAFRGTETTSIRDIKSDIKADITRCDSGGNLHSGFKQAYEAVEIEIQQALDQDGLMDKPLFITGHSLGGALATIAAKKLTHVGGLAACYTFGAPRVGDEEWISDIKTPIYRIVNAADCVTMMPPGSDTISALGLVLSFIPKFGRKARRIVLSKFGGYLHGGNMRYLTNCANGHFETVNLLYSVSFIYRIKMLYLNSMSWKKPLADHSMSVYRKKLAIIAANRN